MTNHQPDPPAVEVINHQGRSPVVLLCEHASRFIPTRYQCLGLAEPDLSRHIAWDIGAADLARAMAMRLDAPLFLHGYSRLLIDPNRPFTAADSIPTQSEDTAIPGNTDLPASERGTRVARYFTPFHDAVAEHLDRRQAARQPTVVVGVHSFTPVFRGVPRPWHAGVLFGDAVAFGRALVAALESPGLVVGTNQPYSIHPDGDYTVPVHGDARGIPAVLFEVRHDLLSSQEDVARWADRLTDALGATSHYASEAMVDGGR
ncbi:MAG: N-formylglutamate amidohydrolase [Gemmatimonadales bacterium]